MQNCHLDTIIRGEMEGPSHPSTYSNSGFWSMKQLGALLLIPRDNPTLHQAYQDPYALILYTISY